MKTATLIFLLLFATHGGANHITPTPEQTSGPFYPGAAAFLNATPDLTNKFLAKGDLTLLEGHVFMDHRPIDGAEVQIWQTDGDQGRYLVEKTDKPLDPNFSYLGSVKTNAKGFFELLTVRPKEYEADEDWTRPDHIHLRVFVKGVLVLTTQFYFSDDQELIDKDLILQALTPEQRRSVIIDFKKDPVQSELAGREVKRGHAHIVL